MFIGAAISGGSDCGDLPELAALQPPREIELFAMLAVWMNPNMLGTLRAKQMHRVSHHHSAFVEMMFVIAISLADAVGRRR